MINKFLRIIAHSALYVTLFFIGLIIYYGGIPDNMWIIILVGGLAKFIADRALPETPGHDDTKMPPTWKIWNDRK